jgi:hypothetical protein
VDTFDAIATHGTPPGRPHIVLLGSEKEWRKGLMAMQKRLGDAPSR